MTATLPETTTAAEEVIPGVYDIPEEDYHADPVPGRSLSSTGARKILKCPAQFRHEQLNPPAPKREFDLGTAAHKLVLGSGPELVVVDAADWRTKAAREKRDAAYDSGATPLLRHEFEQVRAMAEQVRRHPIASQLFNPETGDPEQTLIWQDRQTGIWRRARLDWLPTIGPGRLIVGDLKTTKSAHPDAIQRSVFEYGYHQQAAWYVDGVRELGLADQAAMLFVFQEKTPPYLITVVELDQVSLRLGRERNRQAIHTYAHCVETGHWPGYTDDIALIRLPAWVENAYLRELS
ncbi:PD-(D/E)XK nuclease-like domain-containing protein [Sphaerimonospora mesophila]|uniref:PD-(D/E)XK nuclease-like domain-containing protein n=1 Tax=Sphaerimonospora mesophila TaxID=37483 RepID=UPI0006E235DB